MARMIDADEYERELLYDMTLHGEQLSGDAAYNRALVILTQMPTLTPQNGWVKVMEAINNAAVAYIEGGPYENDLPGMEFALKIDRLSRGFVCRPPEGEGA